eukprot:8840_1
MWIVMKEMILVYFRCMKLSLSIEELMVVINELKAICTTKEFSFNEPQQQEPITVDDMIQQLQSDDTVFKMDEIFTQKTKRQLAQDMATANDLLKEVRRRIHLATLSRVSISEILLGTKFNASYLIHCWLYDSCSQISRYVWHHRSIVYKFAKAWLVRYRQGLANY